MFWNFLLFVSLAASFSQLGASSVTISILSAGLQAALFIIAVLAVVLLWKSYKKAGQPACELI